MNDVKRSTFKSGYCDSMAITLSNRTGLPLGLWRMISVDGDGEEDFTNFHAVCILSHDGPIWLDVDGVSKGKPNDILSNNRFDRIELVEVTEEEVRYAFAFDEAVIDEGIVMAEAYLDADDRLKDIIRQVNAEYASPNGVAPR